MIRGQACSQDKPFKILGTSHLLERAFFPQLDHSYPFCLKFANFEVACPWLLVLLIAHIGQWPGKAVKKNSWDLK
jgi:hypothetical protein